ncbi:MAG: hypothetical protein HYX27_07570 [Acidobacteria bacterium]|nr:hypothetical protein [Acidobacteriota bacterium]
MCRLDGGIRTSILLGWALVFRLTAFWMEPVFSDDLYRYRWEGQVAAAGMNPYDHRPAEPGLAALLSEHVDGKDFKPVYGPLLQTLQLWLARAGGGSLAVMKLGACAAELALCWLLFAWVEEKWRWMAWGWCPMGIVEFWGMGHHDAVMVALAIGALWCAERARWPWAYALLGLAGATKYWPLLLWPAFLKLGGRRWAWLAPAVFVLCWWPWWTDVSENARFMGGYVGGWRNNDILFGAILAAAGSLDTAKRVSAAIIVLGSLGAALWAKTARAAYWAVVLTILLVSANVHPWYLTWLMPLTVFAWPWPVVIWGVLAPIHYAVLIRWREEHVWDGVSNWRWAVYLPVLAALMVQKVRRTRVGESRS